MLDFFICDKFPKYFSKKSPFVTNIFEPNFRGKSPFGGEDKYLQGLIFSTTGRHGVIRRLSTQQGRLPALDTNSVALVWQFL